MEEQLISLETAKLAKEKGFNEICDSHFEKDGETYDSYGLPFKPNDKQEHEILYARPSQSLLQKWLREEHKIHIVIMPCIIPSNEVKYYIFTGKLKWDWAELFDTYEEALEVGLQEALKLVKF